MATNPEQPTATPGEGAPFLTPSDLTALPSKAADHTLAFGAAPQQFGEMRLPADAGPHPVAVVIHGGCWLSAFANVRYTAALADALRDQGIATWNIEYRCIDVPGGGWPGTFEDVGAALDQLREHAARFNLDLSRVIAIGHSAGGSLALWAAGRERLPVDSPIYRANPLALRGVLVLGGLGDLAAFAGIDRSVCGSDVIHRLLGGTPGEHPERYRQASPIELLPLGCPQILITGAREEVVPPAFGAAYADAARLAGDDIEHIIISNAAHHEYCAPGAVTWPVVVRAVRGLLGDSIFAC